MRGIRPPALFELRAHEWRNAVDSHHTPHLGSPLFSKQVRLARPVDIPNWSAWGDLHSQGCSGLSRTGLLFPANHTPGRRAGTCTPAERDYSRREKWTSIRVARPVFRFGRSLRTAKACISRHLCSKKWNPVWESHPRWRFCRPPPELLG